MAAAFFPLKGNIDARHSIIFQTEVSFQLCGRRPFAARTRRRLRVRTHEEMRSRVCVEGLQRPGQSPKPEPIRRRWDEAGTPTGSQVPSTNRRLRTSVTPLWPSWGGEGISAPGFRRLMERVEAGGGW